MTSLLLTSFALSALKDDLLQRTLQVGEVNEYRLETTSRQRIEEKGVALEDGSTVTTLKLSVTIASLRNDGSATVKIGIRDFNVVVPGSPPPTGEAPKPIFFDARLDRRGELSEFDLLAVAPSDQGLLGGVLATLSQAPVFPETKVKKGDKWTRVIPPSPMFGNKELVLNFRFAGDKLEEGVRFSAIEMDDRIPLTVDLGAVGSSQAPTKMEGSITRQGVALYDASGRLAKLVSNFTHDFSVKSSGRVLSGSRSEKTKFELVSTTVPALN